MLYALLLLIPLTAIAGYNIFPEIDEVVNILNGRRSTAPFCTMLLGEYHAGKSFIWYETESGIISFDNRSMRDRTKYYINIFLNFSYLAGAKEDIHFSRHHGVIEPVIDTGQHTVSIVNSPNFVNNEDSNRLNFAKFMEFNSPNFYKFGELKYLKLIKFEDF